MADDSKYIPCFSVIYMDGKIVIDSYGFYEGYDDLDVGLRFYSTFEKAVQRGRMIHANLEEAKFINFKRESAALDAMKTILDELKESDVVTEEERWKKEKAPSTTEEYFLSRVKIALEDQTMVDEFVEWCKEENGVEWWFELLSEDSNFLEENIGFWYKKYVAIFIEETKKD